MSANKPQRITILGATGSIGRSTLDVVSLHPDRFEVFALSANSRIDELESLCIRHSPRFAVVRTEEHAEALSVKLRTHDTPVEVLYGLDGLVAVAAHAKTDTVMAAIVGAAGLIPALAAAQAGKRILLANKEALVLSGGIFMDAVRDSGAILLPIDSEHNAIFQSLPSDYNRDTVAAGIRKILLTASGGPFRLTPVEQLEVVTPEQACAHPNWVMGQKISVDSATMMNKGLEVIEAHWLFNASADVIDVVVHPQSVIHSMVQYLDGSVIAQLGNPDMRTPIANALAYPDRIEAGVASLDLFAIGRLDFEAPDMVRFPCLRLAYECLRQGGAAGAVLNAANEEAVSAFLGKRIRYTTIPEIIERTLERASGMSVENIDRVLETDAHSRAIARSEIEKRLSQ